MRNAASCPDLVSYAEGRLDGARRREIADHVDRCARCREWLATYRTLSTGLSCDAQAPSDRLASYAVSPARIDDETRRALEEHLVRCGRCREELELVRSSLQSAGTPGRSRLPIRPSRIVQPGSFRTSLRIAGLAALLVLAMVGVWLLEPRLSRTPAPPAAVTSVADDPGHTAQSTVAMVIKNTRVRDGGTLSIRAHGPVAFGSGFSVGAGAHLSVEVLKPDPATEGSPNTLEPPESRRSR